MQHAVREESGSIVVALEGEIDLEHSPRARALEESARKNAEAVAALREDTARLARKNAEEDTRRARFEEFKALADIGAEEGKIAEDESRVLNNLLRFDSLVASDVMTPRTVMVSFSASATVKELLTEMEHSPFSRFPVHDASRDEMIGFAMKTDVLLAGAKKDS